jgi:hypothetical protein
MTYPGSSFYAPATYPRLSHLMTWMSSTISDRGTLQGPRPLQFSLPQIDLTGLAQGYQSIHLILSRSAQGI